MDRWTRGGMRVGRWLATVVGIIGWAGLAGAQDAVPLAAVSGGPSGAIDSGDTVWVLLAAMLVMFMTPGLAFFYGGLVRKKNILSVLMQCLFCLCLVSVQWVVCGYSLAFGPDRAGFIGGLDWMWLREVGTGPSAYAPTVPHRAFAVFQMMFAVITPGLIAGAYAERMRFPSFCMFTLLWSFLVYDPVCHWFWGDGGFLKALGAVDFAGGAVVHITAGMAALAAVIVTGKRQGFPDRISPPHNLPFAVLGTGILWFGWYGFNAGSALACNGVATNTFLATHVAASVAGLTWCVLDWIKFGKPTTLGIATGVIAGLASVTPASGFVEVDGAFWIGLGAGVLCWFSVTAFKAKFQYDDSLDAFGVHGIGGIWGTLAVGLWATKAVNAGGVDGLFAGHARQLGIQAMAVGITIAYSFIVSLAIFKIVDFITRLRVSEHDERVGLDVTQHREYGYTVID